MATPKNILLIGGTGIVGSATAILAETIGYIVHTIGLEKNLDLPTDIKQYTSDRTHTLSFQALAEKLNRKVKQWDIVFDIIGSNEDDVRQTCQLFGRQSQRIVFLSTTLVYSRQMKTGHSLQSSHPLAAKGEMGGYVDKKIMMEKYIQTHCDVPWTVLRPYHILGPGSLFGCLPDHNRDPQLVAHLRSGKSLALCHDGEVPLNVVHPRDIGLVALTLAKQGTTIHRAYNCVNPKVITAREYFEEVAHQVGGTLNITNKSYRDVWREQRGWELTTLPHCYDVADLESDIDFVPNMSLQKCVSDALANPPLIVAETPVHKRMTFLPRPKPIAWLID